VTRYYRAPELLCNSKEYDYQVDVWSVGCILGELLGRKPLFEGKNVMHQLRLILDVLGTPSEEDARWITCIPAREFVVGYKSPGIRWADLFPKAPPAALDLLQRMLQFNPAKRMSVNELLHHPFVAGFHDPDTEPLCSRKLDPAIYSLQFKSRQMLQDFAWEEIYKFRPDLRSSASKLTEKYFAQRSEISDRKGKPAFVAPVVGRQPSQARSPCAMVVDSSPRATAANGNPLSELADTAVDAMQPESEAKHGWTIVPSAPQPNSIVSATMAPAAVAMVAKSTTIPAPGGGLVGFAQSESVAVPMGAFFKTPEAARALAQYSLGFVAE